MIKTLLLALLLKACALLLCLLCPYSSAAAQTTGYSFGTLNSWRNVTAPCEAGTGDCLQRRFDIVSGGYVYSVTHAMGARGISPLASIGARNPLQNLPPGTQIEMRTEGKWMYILDAKKKEAKYSIDEVTPAK